MNDKKKTEAIIQWALVAAMAVLLCLPLLQTASGIFAPRKLGGVEFSAKRPMPRAGALLRGEFQSKFTSWFSQNLGLRPWLVRLDNQLRYLLFRELPSASKVVVGENGHLFSAGVIDYYNGKGTVPRAALRRFADNLRELQKRLRARGIGFLFLITPAKTTLFSEHLPARRLRPVRAPGNYEKLKPMLQGVRVLDGVEYYKAWKKRGAPFPLFPKTGTHWSYQSACVFSNHLLKEMESAARLRMARNDCSRMIDFPGQILNDRDLLDLANIMNEKPFLKKTLYPRIGLEAGASGPIRRPNVLYIGDSFLWQILYYMDATRVHERRSVYYYFRRDYRFPENTSAPLNRRALNWRREVFSRDLIVLEINEVHLASLGFGFVDAALARLR